MQRVSKGYTIVEVMIFLAVSAALLGAAINLISGKQSETEFNQKMRDTQSQIQSWLNNVSTGNTGGDTASQTCTVRGNKPLVQNVAPTPAYQPYCTYLGKAIQFTDKTYSLSQSQTIYAYDVFGCRIVGCSLTGDYPDSLFNASPSPVVGQGGVTLMDDFSIAPADIKSVTTSPLANSHLAGFFTSFNTEQSSTQNGNTALNTYVFNYDGRTPPANLPGGMPVVDCLELTACRGVNPQPMTSYAFCMEDGRRTAQITITSNNGIGASVRLDFLAC